jgi:hypothetical protein
METRCPKCGFERLPQASECPVCGVVFAKLAGAPQPAPQAARRQPRPEASTMPPYQRGDAAPGTGPDPYAAPRSSRIVGGPAFPGFGEPQGGYWRAERLVVMERGAELPDRCIRCNALARERVTKTVYWHSPWLYLLLVAWLLYLVTALLVRRRARIAVPFCPEHLKRRRTTITGSWLVVLAGVVALVVPAAGGRDLEWLYLVGVLLLLCGLIAVAVAHRILVAKRIDERHLWLRGASLEFLNSLPAGPSLL